MDPSGRCNHTLHAPEEMWNPDFNVFCKTVNPATEVGKRRHSCHRASWRCGPGVGLRGRRCLRKVLVGPGGAGEAEAAAVGEDAGLQGGGPRQGSMKRAPTEGEVVVRAGLRRAATLATRSYASYGEGPAAMARAGSFAGRWTS